MAPILKPTLAVVIRVMVTEQEHLARPPRRGGTEPPASEQPHMTQRIRREQDDRAERYGGA